MRKQDKAIIDDKCREDWEKLIFSWVHNEVDRQMLIRWALDGLSFESVAEEFCISANHCEVRVQAAKKQLFKHL
jgi:predicted RNA polymerase sigma factor